MLAEVVADVAVAIDELVAVGAPVGLVEQVEHFAGLGIELIETNRFSELMEESDIIDVSNDY